LAHSILDLKHALEFLDVLLDILQDDEVDGGLKTDGKWQQKMQ